MSSYAAVVAIAVSLLAGFYYARWLRAERSLKGAKRDKGAAGKNARSARLVLAGVAVVLVVAVRAWLAGKGR